MVFFVSAVILILLESELDNLLVGCQGSNVASICVAVVIHRHWDALKRSNMSDVTVSMFIRLAFFTAAVAVAIGYVVASCVRGFMRLSAER